MRTSIDYINERNKYSEAILKSDAKKIVVLAGPGCGKTYTFGELLKKHGTNSKNALAVTFINTLVNDLAKDLSSLAEVKTFHALAHKLLRQRSDDGLGQDFVLYDNLAEIVSEDYRIVTDNTPPDFSSMFRNYEDNESVSFYMARSCYYNAVAHDDAVYRVISRVKKGYNSKAAYKVVVVDEFQDFNVLEVEFIENILDVKEKLLIAGDDDQAIYGFRLASPKHIRLRAKGDEYDFKQLPYCSRCTSVVVDATNQIIRNANKNNKLLGRIDKSFICYMPDKQSESEIFPKIIYAACSVQTNKAPYISKYIESAINKISTEEIQESINRGYPTALIIGKTHYIKQVAKYLTNQGFEVDLSIKSDEVVLKEIVFALILLNKDQDNNLAWRLLLHFYKPFFLEEVVSNTDDETPLVGLLPKDFVVTWLKLAHLISEVKDKGDTYRQEDWKFMTSFIGVKKEEIMDYFIKEEEGGQNSGQEVESQVKPTIKLVTHFGAKGLSGGRVFIVGFNNGDFPADPSSPTNTEVCQFLIDITRTRKECHLVSNGRFGLKYGIQPSVFLDWIGEGNTRKIVVDKTYFQKKI